MTEANPPLDTAEAQCSRGSAMPTDTADNNSPSVEYFRDDIFTPNVVSNGQPQQEQPEEQNAAQSESDASQDGQGEAGWYSVPIEGAIYQPALLSARAPEPQHVARLGSPAQNQNQIQGQTQSMPTSDAMPAPHARTRTRGPGHRSGRSSQSSALEALSSNTDIDDDDLLNTGGDQAHENASPQRPEDILGHFAQNSAHEAFSQNIDADDDVPPNLGNRAYDNASPQQPEDILGHSAQRSTHEAFSQSTDTDDDVPHNASRQRLQNVLDRYSRSLTSDSPSENSDIDHDGFSGTSERAYGNTNRQQLESILGISSTPIDDPFVDPLRPRRPQFIDSDEPSYSIGQAAPDSSPAIPSLQRVMGIGRGIGMGNAIAAHIQGSGLKSGGPMNPMPRLDNKRTRKRSG